MIIRYHALARREIIEAAEYYESQREGLGTRFLKQFDATIGLIAQAPDRFEEFRLGLRRCQLKHFPYSVFYRILDVTTIRIVVVKHHSRRPGFGMRRK